MRKIFLSLAALIASAGLFTLVTSGSAEAAPTTAKMSNDNCINPTEKANLRLGSTTQQVNAQTKAHPWFRTTESLDGTRYAIYAYNDCRVTSGKTVAIAYRVAYDGTQHLAFVRYIAL
jgi:hypothetical protein